MLEIRLVPLMDEPKTMQRNRKSNAQAASKQCRQAGREGEERVVQTAQGGVQEARGQAVRAAFLLAKWKNNKPRCGPHCYCCCLRCYPSPSPCCCCRLHAKNDNNNNNSNRNANNNITSNLI